MWYHWRPFHPKLLLHLECNGPHTVPLRRCPPVPSAAKRGSGKERFRCAADLGQLAQLRSLRALKVPGSHQLSTRGLKSLAVLTSITCLDLAGVLISAPRGLASILDTFPLLASLGLQGCRWGHGRSLC